MLRRSAFGWMPLIVQLDHDVRRRIVVTLAAAAGRARRLHLPKKNALARLEGL